MRHDLVLQQAPSAASDWPLGQQRASAPLRASPFSSAPLSPFGAGPALPPAPWSAGPGLAQPRGSGAGAASGAADGREAPTGGASAALPIPGSAGAQVWYAWMLGW